MDTGTVEHIGKITRFCVEALEASGQRVPATQINKAMEMPRLHLFGGLVPRIAKLSDEDVQDQMASLMASLELTALSNLPDVLSLEEQSLAQLNYFKSKFAIKSW